MSSAQEIVLIKSEFDPTGYTEVKGFDFEGDVTLDNLMNSYMTAGFQSTSLAQAINEVNKMLAWRLSDIPIKDSESDEQRDPAYRATVGCNIFLAYTSNMISSGIRETIKFLVKNKYVACITTTAGGVEEDFIKCLAPTYLGDFHLKGKDLRLDGINRIGNLVIPNQNYCFFEDWLMPILDAMADEQVKYGVRWTPSRIINRLGKEINNEDSVYYWAYKNNIPVFCPAITDGSLGDMLYFFSYKRPEFVVDLVDDIRAINNLAVHSPCTGMLILGGGVIKHHTCNANLMRNGAEYSVYINTGIEHDGSDAGASPDEAVSWGKIKLTATPVKVYSEASLVFPLLVSQTFYKDYKKKQEEAKAQAQAQAQA